MNLQAMPTTNLVQAKSARLLFAHSNKWAFCQQCQFGINGGRKVIFRGYVPAQVLFIGEAPGWSEHATGKPFVGPSGDVLDRIISESASLSKIDFKWAVTNSVLCTPLGDDGELETPKVQHLAPCSHRLYEFIEIVNPSLIVKVGAIAQRSLPDSVKVNGRQVRAVGIYHPSWILRQRDPELSEKKAVYSLLSHIKETLNAATPNS